MHSRHPSTELPSGKKIYFVSDVHLGVPDRASSLERERRLVAWLDRAAEDAAAIHLVGDLFDFWFEYRHAVPRGFVRILGKLAELSDRGIPLYAYTGNHDLWMFDYFPSELGVPVFREPQSWTYGKDRFLVGHGDGIGPGDYGYKFIKRVFSNPLCQWAFARLHPNFGVGLALFWSRRSRMADAGKDDSFQAEQEPQVVYARQVLERESYRYFLFGHRHCPVQYPLSPEASLVNLGDWMTHFSYAVYDGQSLRLERWSPQPSAAQKPAGAAARMALLLSLGLAALLTGTQQTAAISPVPPVPSATIPSVPATQRSSAEARHPLLTTGFRSTGQPARAASLFRQPPVRAASLFSARQPASAAGLSNAGPARDSQAELLFQLPGSFVDLAVDGLGNLFTLSARGELCRYSEDGRLLYQFSEVRFGRVGSLDVSNPLRVLLYYPEYLSVVLLSNTLAPVAEINLRSLGLNRVRAAGLARDGRIWVYDEANFELLKLDERGQVVRRSEPLNYVLGLELQPTQLIERNDRLFLLDPRHGVLVFDAFGTFDYRFGAPGIRHMQIYAEEVITESAEGFSIHNLKSYQDSPADHAGRPNQPLVAGWAAHGPAGGRWHQRLFPALSLSTFAPCWINSKRCTTAGATSASSSATRSWSGT
jgi:UDP-2,3-diacylglucosamine hydrolase